jgi:D-3-phosphoglycerate dehydrogenase
VRHAAILDQIYTECDYITLHLPLNASTKNMIAPANLKIVQGGRRAAQLRPRGGLVDTAAVVAAL